MLDKLIDIHSHTLWEIDDGARSFSETMEMCSIAEDCETDVLFLTPHLIYWNQAEALLDERDEKTGYLEEMLEKEGSSLRIIKGFEILCDDDIFDIKYFKPYTLNNSRYILIEFDFFKTTEEDVKAWCRYLQSHSLVPVIAHPERYSFVIQDRGVLDRLSDMGVLFQINAGSPVGVFGDDEMELSCAMLEAGYVDFIGSDAHREDIRNTDMITFIDDFPYSISEEEIEKFAYFNPMAIIKNEEIISKRKKNLGIS